MRPWRRVIPYAALFGVALLARGAAVVALDRATIERATYEHGEIAANLVAGRGFSVRFLGQDGPTSQQAPLYPAMLAALYAVFGVESHAAILAMQWLQAIAGACLTLVVVWLTRSLVGDRRWIAWLAGWGAALYPPHVYMTTHIQVAPWAALVLTLVVAMASEPRFRQSSLAAACAGVVTGLMLLFDPILALAVPVVAATMRRAWFRATIFLAMTTLVIFPWMARNRLVHGEWVFIKSTFGYALWQGNNAISHGTDKVPKPSAEALRTNHDGTLAGMHRAMWEARHETLYIDDVLLAPSGYQEFEGRGEPERSRMLGRRAVEFIAAHPARYARLCANRLRFFLLWDETNPKAAHPIYRASSLAWLALFCLGLVASRRRLRPHAACLAIVGAVSLFHVLTITSARFRIPLEPLTFGLCAEGVAAVWLVVTRVAAVPHGRGRSSHKRNLAMRGGAATTA